MCKRDSLNVRYAVEDLRRLDRDPAAQGVRAALERLRADADAPAVLR